MKAVRACKSLSWHTSRFQRSISTETDIQSPAANSSLSASWSSSCNINKPTDEIHHSGMPPSLIWPWYHYCHNKGEYLSYHWELISVTWRILMTISWRHNASSFFSFFPQQDRKSSLGIFGHWNFQCFYLDLNFETKTNNLKYHATVEKACQMFFNFTEWQQ